MPLFPVISHPFELFKDYSYQESICVTNITSQRVGGGVRCWAKINVSQFKKCDNNFNKLHYSSSVLFTPDLFRNSATDVSKSESWLLEVSSDFWATWDGTSLFSVNNTVSALWKIKTSYIKVIYSLIIIIYLHVMSMNSKKSDLVKTHPMTFIYLN